MGSRLIKQPKTSSCVRPKTRSRPSSAHLAHPAKTLTAGESGSSVMIQWPRTDVVQYKLEKAGLKTLTPSLTPFTFSFPRQQPPVRLECRHRRRWRSRRQAAREDARVLMRARPRGTRGAPTARAAGRALRHARARGSAGVVRLSGPAARFAAQAACHATAWWPPCAPLGARVRAVGRVCSSADPAARLPRPQAPAAARLFSVNQLMVTR